MICKSKIQHYFINIEFIKEGTRPKYWRPDNECHVCFICKQPFNNTTRRLHHWYVI
jgi:hypothetical protein